MTVGVNFHFQPGLTSHSGQGARRCVRVSQSQMMISAAKYWLSWSQSPSPDTKAGLAAACCHCRLSPAHALLWLVGWPEWRPLIGRWCPHPDWAPHNTGSRRPVETQHRVGESNIQLLPNCCGWISIFTIDKFVSSIILIRFISFNISPMLLIFRAAPPAEVIRPLTRPWSSWCFTQNEL